MGKCRVHHRLREAIFSRCDDDDDENENDDDDDDN